MKLIVKSEQDEEYEIVIHPDDTFNDVQNRLFENRRVFADLKKLAMPNKPFNLSENVMNYFGFLQKSNPDNLVRTQYNHDVIENFIPGHSDSLGDTEENVLDDNFTKEEASRHVWGDIELRNYEVGYKDSVAENKFPGVDEAAFKSEDLKERKINFEIYEEGEEKIRSIDVEYKADNQISDENQLKMKVLQNKTSSDEPEEIFRTENLEDKTEHAISRKDKENEILRNANLKDEAESQISEEGEEGIFMSDQINLDNIFFPDDLLSEPMPLCRLCAQEICNDELAYIHDVVSSDGTTLADKINACLPITVNLKDKLPKQVCSECLISLDYSYTFSQSVISAEEALHTLQLSTKVEHMNCPLCCEGNMETMADPDTRDSSPQPDDVDVEDEKPVTDENIVVPPPVIVKSFQIKKRKRPKKFEDYDDIDENDKDWTYEDEMEPPRKKSGFRGRPKGSKNKSTKSKNMDCFICHSKFKDHSEALSHALNAHCDSLNETYPCPLCQSTLTSEQELTDHIDTHNNKREVVLIQCGLCGVQASQASEIYNHVLDQHVNSAEKHYTCSLCQNTLEGADQMVAHVIQGHIDNNTCPICIHVVSSPEEMKSHLTVNHVEQEFGNRVVCSECKLRTDSQTDYLNHIMEQHCTTTIYKVPAHYTCYNCNNNFRSQYHLVKHTCNIIFEELFCRECDRVFPTKARYVFHLNTHHPNFPGLRCDQCWAIFNNEDTFYDHVRFQHEPDEQIQCEECNKVFKNELSLSMHMRRHQANRDHKCMECGKRFQNAQTLREHQVSHMSVKPYQCHICGAYLSRLSRLRIHLRTHSVKSSKASMKAYKCSVCTQLFPNTKDAFNHAEGHAETNVNLEEEEVTLVFRCEYCDACFQQTTDLRMHRKEKHANPEAHNAYTCSVCGAQFSTFARVTTHKLTHGINTETLIVPDEVKKGEETFVIPQFFLCHECDKRCLHYTYMNLHRRFHHAAGKPIYPCNICGEKFATSWSLTFHKKKQHQIWNDNSSEAGDDNRRSVNTLYHCPECDKPYVTETSLEMHIKKCHQAGQGDDLSSNFICETCGKTFQFKTALEAHADGHRGLKRFECEVCGKRFTHRAGLIRHMKLHSESDPLVCEFCGKKFRDRTERENHRRAHTGERPFMCDVCGRTFHTRAVWLDHSRIHQDIRPYQCDICTQSFRRSYALKSHYLIHTGERPYACEVCGKTFRLRQTLFAHNKKEHQTPVQTILPDDALLKEDNSQFADDDGLSEIGSEDLVAKTFMNRSGEIVIKEKMKVPASSLLNSANIVKQGDHWKMESKSVLVNKSSPRMVLKDSTVGDQPLSQQGYSLLLKSDHISLDGTH